MVAHFGFMETPRISHVLTLRWVHGVAFDMTSTTFVLGRETLLVRVSGVGCRGVDTRPVTPYTLHLSPDALRSLCPFLGRRLEIARGLTQWLPENLRATIRPRWHDGCESGS